MSLLRLVFLCLFVSVFIGLLACEPTTRPPVEQRQETPLDGGSEPTDTPAQDGEKTTIPCGNGTCPSAEYVCCQNNKDAPPECCLKGYNACYSGGGGLTGWPVYNGCNVQKCLPEKPKHCPGGSRGTCCRQNETCGESFGIAFCQDKSCPADRKCNGGKLCCSQKGICKPFKNVEYCDEPCANEGKVKCSLTGKHYGESQSIHVCCPKGDCRHHPDGWPFCVGEVY